MINVLARRYVNVASLGFSLGGLALALSKGRRVRVVAYVLLAVSAVLFILDSRETAETDSTEKEKEQ